MYVHVYFVVPFTTLYNVYVSFLVPCKKCITMHMFAILVPLTPYVQCTWTLCSSLYDTVQTCTMYMFSFSMETIKPWTKDNVYHWYFEVPFMILYSYVQCMCTLFSSLNTSHVQCACFCVFFFGTVFTCILCSSPYAYCTTN